MISNVPGGIEERSCVWLPKVHSLESQAALRGIAAENAQLKEASNDLNIPRTQYLKQQAFPCLKRGLEILTHTGCYEEVRTVLIAIYKVISCVLASRSLHREK